VLGFLIADCTCGRQVRQSLNEGGLFRLWWINLLKTGGERQNWKTKKKRNHGMMKNSAVLGFD